MARVPLKNCFCLVIMVPGKYKYILLSTKCAHMQLSPEHLQKYSLRTFWRFSWLSLVILVYTWFPLVSLGYPCFSLFILGCPWLSLVSLGYPWLYLVIYNLNICEIVCAFAIIIPLICRNLLQSQPDKMTMRKPGITSDNQG